MARRVCAAYPLGKWQQVDAGLCVDFRLADLSRADITDGNVATACLDLVNITGQSPADRLGVQDVANAIVVLNNIAKVRQNNLTLVLSTVASVANDVIALPPDVAEAGQETVSELETSRDASTLPQLLETVLEELSSKEQLSAGVDTLAFENVGIGIVQAGTNTSTTRWDGSVYRRLLELKCNVSGFASCTMGFLEGVDVDLTTDASSRLAVAVYRNDVLFFGSSAKRSSLRRSRASRRFVNSAVASVNVAGSSTETQLPAGGRVLIRLPNRFPAGENSWVAAGPPTCSFWRFSTASWETQGCTVRSYSDSETVCECTHLTNFAVLTNTNPPTTPTSSLNITLEGDFFLETSTAARRRSLEATVVTGLRRAGVDTDEVDLEFYAGSIIVVVTSDSSIIQRIQDLLENRAVEFDGFNYTVSSPSKTTQSASNLPLDILGAVCVAISVLCLVTTAAVYIAIPKIRTESKVILVFLCLTLAAADLVFVFGVGAVSDQDTCTALAITMHYLFLSAFMWMFVHGWHLYKTFTDVFASRQASATRMPRYALFAFGVPAVVVAATAGAAGSSGYGNEQACWLISSGPATVWAFVGPAAATVLLNLAMFARIVVVIVRLGEDRRVTLAMRRGVKASLSFLTVMGLGWTFGFIAVGSPGSTYVMAMQYLFNIFAGLQGVFVLWFHCLWDPALWRHWQLRKEQRKRAKTTQLGMASRETGDSRPSTSAPLLAENNSGASGTLSTGMSSRSNSMWAGIPSSRGSHAMLGPGDNLLDVAVGSTELFSFPGVLEEEPTMQQSCSVAGDNLEEVSAMQQNGSVAGDNLEEEPAMQQKGSAAGGNASIEAASKLPPPVESAADVNGEEGEETGKYSRGL